MHRLFRHLFWLCLVLAILWAVGLISYIALVAQIPSFNPSTKGLKADAAIVLTGGSERIEAGLGLLKEGHIKQLFISGVHQDATIERLTQGQNVPSAQQRCCIALGYQAQDTAGNAQEAAAWLKDKNYSAVVLVTAHYHMLRSLLEFRRALPTLEIIPFAVAPKRVNTDEWWNSAPSVKLFLEEYHKLLAAFVRFGVHKFKN